jgi:hypothetical protein
MNKVLKLATATVEVHEHWTRTVLHDGQEIGGIALHVDSYRCRAKVLGYGDDVDAMNRDHEVTHSLLAHWLGMPESPVMRAIVAHSGPSDLTGSEERVVLALQEYAKLAGVDLLEVARRLST